MAGVSPISLAANQLSVVDNIVVVVIVGMIRETRGDSDIPEAIHVFELMRRELCGYRSLA